jgi:hypothetical protein
MIFSIDDLSIFAPSVSLSEDAVTGAIYFVQSIIEGDRGADRPLEITRHRERLRVNLKFQNFRLTYVSINITDGFNRAIAPDSWRTLGSNDYIIDIDGQIHLSTAIGRSWGYGGYRGYSREPYPEFSEADVEYSSGIDFTQDTRQTREIKAAFGRVLDWVCNTGSFKGVSSVELPFEEVKINYGTGQLGTIPDDLLMIFKKYRPIKL